MKKVTIYTTPTCRYCNDAKEFFKENNVEYVSIDVAADKEARELMVEKSGQRGVPVIIIEGGEVITGFNKEALKEALDIK